MLKSLKENIASTREKVNALEGRKSMCLKVIEDYCEEESNIADAIGQYEKAIVLLQMFADTKQSSIVKLFEDTVTYAIRFVFSNDYKFKIKFNRNGGSMGAEFLLHTKEYKGYLPLKMCQGKSVVEIIAVIMQIIFVHLLDVGKMIWCDESVNGIEIDRQDKVGKLFAKMSKEFNVQIVLVTHLKTYHDNADKVISI